MGKFIVIFNNVIYVLFAALLGILAIIIPVLILPNIKHYNYGLLPPLTTGFENASLTTLKCLILAGILLGFLRPKKGWLWGVAMASIYPIIAIIEAVLDIAPHNLLPFEFIFYAFYMFLGIIGTILGALLRLRKNFKMKLYIRGM